MSQAISLRSWQLPPAKQANCLRIVTVGDIVGKPGMRIACAAPTWFRSKLSADLIIVNAENAADGSGLRCKEYRKLIESGVDGITLGDHVYKKREIVEVLDSRPNIIRPANLPREAPGKSLMVLRSPNGIQVAVTCALGRVFLKPADCPFRAVDEQLQSLADDIRIRVVEMHAEATSDKQLMGRYLDGRVSAVVGTHTHVATADEQILPGGTGYHSDLGMTGPFESILGRQISPVLQATLHGVPVPFPVATKQVRLNGAWLDIQIDSGTCAAIGRIDVGEEQLSP